LIFFIFIHSNLERKSDLFTKAVSSLTTIPGISLSTLGFEPRIREYKDFSHTIYPEQKKINYLDFVYED